MKFDLSLVTINFNGSEDTLDLLDSLLASNYDFKSRLIIVDNASELSDYSALYEGLRKREVNLTVYGTDVVTSPDEKPYKLNLFQDKIGLKLVELVEPKVLINNLEVILLRTPRNEGFAAANNIAINLFENDKYVLIINNDMVLDKNSISDLVKAADDTSSDFVTGPVMFYSTNNIWYGGGADRFEPRIKSRHKFKHKDISEVPLSDLTETSFVTGAYFLVSRKYINRNGLFNEAFFFGEEDAVLSDKIQKEGCKISFVGEAVSWHKVGVSRSKKRSKWLQVVHWHSKFFWAKLTKGSLNYALWFTLFLLYVILKDIKVNLTGKEKGFDNLKIFFDAFRESKKLSSKHVLRRSSCYIIVE